MTELPAELPADDDTLALLLADLFEQQDRGEVPNWPRLRLEHPNHADELYSLWTTAGLADEFVRAPSSFDQTVLGTSLETDGSSTSVEQLPRQFGDYVLQSELGRGGMGVVFRATQASLRREVAIKMILSGDLASGQDIDRFRAEAEASARLNHPNIVSVFEVGKCEGRPYFSMQYVRGTTLAQRISERPLTGPEAATLLIPICRAVAFAHRQGVLHRDLKPSNILIETTGQPFVTDFGLAKRITPDSGERETNPGSMSNSLRSLTQSGAILGTPGYMAPEQAAGTRGVVGPGTDVYALGAVLYAAVTGRAPFQGATPVDAVLMVLEQDPLPPRLLNSQIDSDLELIILKTLQKPADLRYDSADRLADDLEAYLRNDPISARSSQLSQIISRAFRPTHHVAVLENWGLLWMLHSLVLLVLCLLTNWLQLRHVDSRMTYASVWTLGLGTWAIVFWNLRHRSGPVTFVERQIAHVWAASMACSTGLFGVEAMLGLPALKLSPVLALIAAGVFVVKAGILSGEFYIHALMLFATAIPMAMFPRYGITMFGIVGAATFFLPGLKFYRQRLHSARR
ncbi:MAG: serine/threonine-protein kinase [Planctomycetaceae bacterium]